MTRAHDPTALEGSADTGKLPKPRAAPGPKATTAARGHGRVQAKAAPDEGCGRRSGCPVAWKGSGEPGAVALARTRDGRASDRRRPGHSGLVRSRHAVDQGSGARIAKGALGRDAFSSRVPDGWGALLLARSRNRPNVAALHASV